MILFNDTLEIGRWIQSATVNVTGDLSMTLLIIVVLLLLIALIFKEPLILFGLIILPLIIVFATYEGVGGLFYTVLTVFGVIIAWQFAKIIIGWGK